MTEMTQVAGAHLEKFMVFDLGQAEYAIPLTSVREVIALATVTKVPNMPAHYFGLINLRGGIISIIDLRKRLNLLDSKIEVMKTCIIIVEIMDIVLGLVVDEIKSVVSFDQDEIQKDVHIQSQVDRQFMFGIARRQSGLTFILDVGKIVSSEDIKNGRRA